MVVGKNNTKHPCVSFVNYLALFASVNVMFHIVHDTMASPLVDKTEKNINPIFLCHRELSLYKLYYILPYYEEI